MADEPRLCADCPGVSVCVSAGFCASACGCGCGCVVVVVGGAGGADLLSDGRVGDGRVGVVVVVVLGADREEVGRLFRSPLKKSSCEIRLDWGISKKKYL